VIQNYIDGKLVEPSSQMYLDNYEPATGKIYGKIPDSDAEDIALAVKAAQKAFPIWSTTPAKKRSQLLLKISTLIDQQLQELANAESKDNGKAISLATSVDIPRASANFYFFGTALLHFASESHMMEDTAINYTIRSPLGVVGCISPWNLPLYLFTWKIAPALAAGNCVIAKPSEVTPLTAFLLSKICIEAGLPPGVLNIVHGLGTKVGDAISRHPDIVAISFTGGTKTGAEIAHITAPMFKKVALELGGKNPNIIFADCNFDEMLTTTVRSSFSNQGEICLCGSRIFIERSIYNEFKEKFIKKTKELVVGDPMAPKTDLGAIVSAQHLDKILSYIELARQEGGTVLTGGQKVELDDRCTNGWFIEPTIIEGLPYNCRTNQEEIFGPVVTITPFDTEEEVLMYANSTQYGLSSTIWTQDLTRAHRLAGQIQTGIVWVNCWMVRDLRTPFGGVKSSGYGSREGGWEIFRFFTQPKNVTVQLK
jgi:aminomuconate-semialdehyde/2-hydroxymuconate-6-semialdehyde dehydrogenase